MELLGPGDMGRLGFSLPSQPPRLEGWLVYGGAHTLLLLGGQSTAACVNQVMEVLCPIQGTCRHTLGLRIPRIGTGMELLHGGRKEGPSGPRQQITAARKARIKKEKQPTRRPDHCGSFVSGDGSLRHLGGRSAWQMDAHLRGS